MTIRAGDGQELVDQTSMSDGDEVLFTIGEEYYRLRVERLINALFGKDFGVIRVRHVSASEVDEKIEQRKIERMIDLLEKSDLIWIRDEEEYTPTKAADHIRKKYKYAGKEIRTAEDFIDKVAARSWVSGRDYMVRLPDGSQVTAKKWFRDQLAKLSERN